MAPTVWLVVSLQVVTSETTRSMTSSSVHWRQPRHRPYWSQHHLVALTDGKRPDGLTIVPWARGRSLVWDFTCPDTLAASHLNRAVVGPGAVATDAEEREKSKYSSLSPLYDFKPTADGDFWSHRRIGDGLLPAARTPHRHDDC